MNTFSSQIKKELSELSNLANKDIVKAELKGYWLTNDSTEFVTESKYNINRFGKLLSNVYINDYKINLKGNNFQIKTKRNYPDEFSNYEINSENLEELKGVLRGTFMGSGTITDLQNRYHLEILFDKLKNAKYINQILLEFGIKSNVMKRENKYIVYIEEGESISNFLAYIGANKSVLKFENTRVIKEVRNKVNRLVNCETANLNKTINTSVKQIEDIKYLKQIKKFNELTEKEQELANLRIENPNASLQELGEMLDIKLSKSGVNHRLASILKKASNYKNEKNVKNKKKD